MKTIRNLFFAATLFTTQIINAQSCKDVGTTAEEYNYIVKGYKVQLESGLDMKKGYYFSDEMFSAESDGRKIAFKGLMKDNPNQYQQRAIMATYTGKDNITHYICIPLGACSQEIRQAYFDAVASDVDVFEALNFYQYNLARLLAFENFEGNLNLPNATTIEEYNYIVKGYKVQLESGLDMKKGYELRLAYSIELGGRQIVFKELIKDGSDLRGWMAIFTGQNGETHYICIPTWGNQATTQAYWNDVRRSVDNGYAMNFYQNSLARLLNTYETK